MTSPLLLNARATDLRIRSASPGIVTACNRSQKDARLVLISYLPPWKFSVYDKAFIQRHSREPVTAYSSTDIIIACHARFNHLLLECCYPPDTTLLFYLSILVYPYECSDEPIPVFVLLSREKTWKADYEDKKIEGKLVKMSEKVRLFFQYV